MNTHLEKRKKLGNFRELRIVNNLIDFASNDYLGLARSPDLVSSVLQEWQQHKSLLNGLGSTGSRLLTGNSTYAQDLEERIAKIHGFEAGVLFSCGYMANVGLLSCVAHPKDTLFFDEKVHASMRCGIKLSKAAAFAFKHNDLAHLEKRLQRCSQGGMRFICIDSIYSTDGSRAPLVEIHRLAKEYDAHLIVDEAHSIGVHGPKGLGLVAEYNLDVFATIITFGKALGTYGALVLGKKSLQQNLINLASTFIYTTALPLQILTAIKCSYELFPKMEQERRHISSLIKKTPSATHIYAVKVSGNEAAKRLSQRLENRGFDVRPLLSPTVPKGEEVLRLCLHAFNTEDELQKCLELL